MTKEIRVSAGGRIVIPKSIRDKLGITRGEKVLIEIDGRKIILRKLEEENPIEKMYGSVKVRPEPSPKKVAREWMREKVEADL
jgi:AbrB family looped-hinge helix DNA binding protein